jgi:hypothetical protein
MKFRKSLPVYLLVAAAASGLAQDISPKAKILATPEDPTTKTILVGRASAGNMEIMLELEPAKTMWMRMGQPGQWMAHSAGKGEVFHVEVKPTDPRSKTRIPYADVTFDAVNRSNNKQVRLALHPMWGSSGLHYAANSALLGDGVYFATVTVGVPAFSRDIKDKDLWMKPASAKFHFRLAGNKLTEVSEPAAVSTTAQ